MMQGAAAALANSLTGGIGGEHDRLGGARSLLQPRQQPSNSTLQMDTTYSLTSIGGFLDEQLTILCEQTAAAAMPPPPIRRMCCAG